MKPGGVLVYRIEQRFTKSICCSGSKVSSLDKKQESALKSRIAPQSINSYELDQSSSSLCTQTKFEDLFAAYRLFPCLFFLLFCFVSECSRKTVQLNFRMNTCWHVLQKCGADVVYACVSRCLRMLQCIKQLNANSCNFHIFGYFTFKIKTNKYLCL